jgi:hypothetical protein
MTELPKDVELQKIPLRGIAAYAFRCAKRVQPLFRKHHLKLDRNIKTNKYFLVENVVRFFKTRNIVEPFSLETLVEDKYEYYLSSINKAIILTKCWSNGIKVNKQDLFYAADSCYDIINHANPLAPECRPGCTADLYATQAAYTAAWAAEYIENANYDTDAIFSSAENSILSSSCAAFLADNYYKNEDTGPIFVSAYDPYTSSSAAISAIIDYQKLLRLNLDKYEPIDASENGPLGPYWPDGEPDWYKELYPQMRALLDEPLEE